MLNVRLSILSNKASSFSINGEFERAAEYLTAIVIVRRDLLGGLHTDTLQAMGHLEGLNNERLGNYDAAERGFLALSNRLQRAFRRRKSHNTADCAQSKTDSEVYTQTGRGRDIVFCVTGTADASYSVRNTSILSSLGWDSRQLLGKWIVAVRPFPFSDRC